MVHFAIMIRKILRVILQLQNEFVLYVGKLKQKQQRIVSKYIIYFKINFFVFYFISKSKKAVFT